MDDRAFWAFAEVIGDGEPKRVRRCDIFRSEAGARCRSNARKQISLSAPLVKETLCSLRLLLQFRLASCAGFWITQPNARSHGVRRLHDE